jgi:hypothetical protein
MDRDDNNTTQDVDLAYVKNAPREGHVHILGLCVVFRREV